MTGRRTRWAWLLAAAVLAWPAVAAADGPGSGDEVSTKQPNKKMLRRIWKYSKARRAQERRIRELKRKIELLRTAVPKLQSAAMKEAERQRRYDASYRVRKARFAAKWRKVVKLFGKSPVSLYSDVYARFGISRVWTADTTDWKRCLRRMNNADGDDFYLYTSFSVPKFMVKRDFYAVDWKITGYDFNGNEKTLYYKTNYSWSREFQRFRFQHTTFRRRLTGLGLTPGWYEVEARLKVRRKRWLQRRFYSAVYVSRVNPMISAPPASYWRYKKESMIKLTKLRVKSRGVKRGQLNPKKFEIRGKYEVHKSFTGSDKQIVIGASVYQLGRHGRVLYGQLPIRTAFRFRKKLKRTKGRFGGKDTTRVKGLDKGLGPGKYVVRIWAMVSGPKWKNYWAYEDKPFEIKHRGLRPLPRPRRGR